MDAMERTEKLQAAATAVGALVALVPAASIGGNIFVAILAALGRVTLQFPHAKAIQAVQC